MEIAVCVKRVPDTSEAEVRVDATGRDIVSDKLAFTINEADNYALEEALLLKEKLGANVTLVTVGPKAAEEVLRMGLAKGAAAAVRIDDAGLSGTDSLAFARVLAGFFRNRSCDLILTGCIASDDGCSQVGPALAELLGWPHAAYVVRLEPSEGKLEVRRELEGGLLEVKEVKLPCVLSIQTGGCSPRYASIMGIKRAASRPIEQASPVVHVAGLSQLVRLYVPETTSAAQMLGGTTDEKAARLAELLRERGIQ
uniref:Electron transfer flavoprotein subunit beta n=1 Tax=candidate division WOR-3 bacterium TaxID=2052148 RepID=A0A7C4CC57_UNCW3